MVCSKDSEQSKWKDKKQTRTEAYLAFISKNKGGFVIFSILAFNWLSARAGKTGGSFISPSKSNRRQLEAAVKSLEGEVIRTTLSWSHRTGEISKEDEHCLVMPGKRRVGKRESQKRRLSGFVWRASGWDSALSLLGPRYNPWCHIVSHPTSPNREEKAV